jgi:cytochrome c
MRARPLIPVLIFLAIGTSTAKAAGDAAAGAELYEFTCTACHALDFNRTGPKHRGVFGRKAGSLAEFDYSPALKSANVVWDEASLDRWLTNPEAFIPGQKMNIRVSGAESRADIIAFLRKVSGS